MLMVVVVESNNPGCIRIRGKVYVTLLVRVLLSVKVAEGQLLVHVGLALSQFWLSEEEWGDREREREVSQRSRARVNNEWMGELEGPSVPSSASSGNGKIQVSSCTLGDAFCS